MSDRPNILFIVVDQWRYPVSYESKELQEWKRKNLKFYELLSNNGTVFHRHYTNTNACVPARTTIQTGVYPSIHGNISTDAIAKTATDPEMKWLPPYTVPTMGNYFTRAGYQTFLKGKWHISDAGIRGLSDEYIPTFDINGVSLPEYEDFYLKENVLRRYGYNGWIGPEPHGRIGLNTASSVPNSAIGRDEKFVNQTLEVLDRLETSTKPWFLNINILDPHDIVLFGKIAGGATSNFEFDLDPTLPEVLFTKEFEASFSELLLDKPITQKKYIDMYETVFQPLFDSDTHIRYYYTLMKRADDHLMRIWNKLITMKAYDNTIIVFTSDHGDLLCGHGGMQQKWFQAYDESIHVPLIISSPLLNNEHNDIHELTSHIDLLPTFLDMAGIDSNLIRKQLSNKFSLAVPLSGSSIFPLIINKPYKSRPVYFYTEDDITSGSNQINALGQSYNSMDQPSCVEAIIVHLNGQLWKYTEYYSLDTLFIDTGIRNELYNISADPLELNNLHNKDDIEPQLHNLLLYHSLKYRGLRNFVIWSKL